ncbi:MAG: esterase/lipase family protein [Desulfosoma sp.]|uniref:esterase/lipase family protein n=1 Tax=Desulfosoma sp. TaxID=2603217 RepID=UPI00404ACA50
MIAVLCIFFGFITLFAALTYVLYWYDTANGPALDDLRNRSQGRPRFYVLRGFLWALIAQTLALLTFPLGLLPERQRASRPSANTGPIIITIHGLYHNRSAFLFVHRALRRAGFHDVRSWSYASWSADFFQRSAQLARDLRALHHAEPLRPIVLIGHSLGGLLARHAAVTVGSNTLAGCLTLGTPHQGSRLAVFALGYLGRSLGYRSPLIEKIERDESSFGAPNFSCVALSSPVDNMVLPTEALQPPGSHWKVRWTPPMSHVAMLYHMESIREIVAWTKECASTQNRFPGGQSQS